MPKKLSQSGPGVAWQDLDGEGWEDLVIGSGNGGKLAAYRNQDGKRVERLQGLPWDEIVSRDQGGSLVQQVGFWPVQATTRTVWR